MWFSLSFTSEIRTAIECVFLFLLCSQQIRYKHLTSRTPASNNYNIKKEEILCIQMLRKKEGKIIALHLFFFGKRRRMALCVLTVLWAFFYVSSGYKFLFLVHFFGQHLLALVHHVSLWRRNWHIWVGSIGYGVHTVCGGGLVCWLGDETEFPSHIYTFFSLFSRLLLITTVVFENVWR